MNFVALPEYFSDVLKRLVRLPEYDIHFCPNSNRFTNILIFVARHPLSFFEHGSDPSFFLSSDPKAEKFFAEGFFPFCTMDFVAVAFRL